MIPWRVLLAIAGTGVFTLHSHAQDAKSDPLLEAEAIVKAASQAPPALQPIQLLSLVIELGGTRWGYSDVRCTFFPNGTFEHIDIYNDRRKAKGTWKQTGASVTASASYPGRVNQEYPFNLSLSGTLDGETLRGKLSYTRTLSVGGTKSETQDTFYKLQK